MKKRSLAIAIASTILLYGITAINFKSESLSDDIVRVGESRSIFDFLNVHSSPDHYLTIQGKTYYHLRGNEPYYLRIPQLNAILFVTERSFTKIDIHIVDIATGKATKIDGGGETFGDHICSVKTPGNISDEIFEVSGTELVAVSSCRESKKYLYLDLDHKELKWVVWEELDSNGEVAKRSVYSKGVLVKGGLPELRKGAIPR